MRDVYPGHFEKFCCIAGDCGFTCCREWRIHVDDGAFRKWQKKGIRNAVTRNAGRRVARLTDDGSCPHLDGDGLCRLITEYGEELLPEGCRAFPREERVFPDRTEHSLMTACPEVVRLLRDGFSVPGTSCGLQGDVKAGDQGPYDRKAGNSGPENGETENGKTEDRESENAEAENRENENRETENGETENGLERLRGRWMNAVRESASPEEAFLNLFHVPEALRHMPEELCGEERARLYEDLTENYRAEGLYRRFWEEEEEAGPSGGGVPDIWEDHADLVLSCILSDVWSDCLKPGFTEREMHMKLAWTAMKYAAVRRFTELRPARREAGYSVLRDGIVLMTRIMSMDDAEIFSWLEETFDDPVWGPEYPALLFGGMKDCR